MAWLRATVARFSAGETHARRRALVVADLARLDTAALRNAAALGPDGEDRLRSVSVLAEALGLAEPDAVADAIAVVAGTYFGDGHDAAADEAVAWLLPRVLSAESRAEVESEGDAAMEAAANRIGLLVQALSATGDLIEHARRAAAGHPVGHDIDTLLAETLRHDPPVRAIHRLAVRDTHVAGIDLVEGDVVTLDIAAANRDPEVFTDPEVFGLDRSGPPSLTFGSLPRVCPGRDHALALAAGVLSRDSEALISKADAGLTPTERQS